MQCCFASEAATKKQVDGFFFLPFTLSGVFMHNFLLFPEAIRRFILISQLKSKHICSVDYGTFIQPTNHTEFELEDGFIDCQGYYVQRNKV